MTARGEGRPRSLVGWPSSALGLRSRIVGVVLVTTVATLAVAALALLGPLENSLRKAEQTTLRRELNHRALGDLRRPAARAHRHLAGRTDRARPGRERLQSRISATVTVLGNPQQQDGSGSQPLINPRDTDDTFGDVAIAFRTRKRYLSFGTVDGRTYARAAIPFVSSAEHRLARGPLRARGAQVRGPDHRRRQRRAHARSSPPSWPVWRSA